MRGARPANWRRDFRYSTLEGEEKEHRVVEEEAEGALGGRCANWWEFFVTAVVSGWTSRVWKSHRRTCSGLEITKGSKRDLVISESITSSTSQVENVSTLHPNH